MGKYFTTDSNGKKVPKKSGASHSTYVPTKGANKGNNQYITNAWCIIKGDLYNFSCVTTKESRLKKSGWFGNVRIEMLNKVTAEKKTLWSSMEKKTGKVLIDELSFVLNPKAPNGGYCGTFTR